MVITLLCPRSKSGSDGRFLTPCCYQVCHSQADIGKAERLLGYESTHTIAQGLQDALGWYEKGP
jgi:nucleoside-diphosphate-sugar epimerase